MRVLRTLRRATVVFAVPPALLLAAVAAAVFGQAADAESAHQQFNIGGRPWPGHLIRYFNGVPDQQAAIAQAAAAWNRSGTNVRFVSVPRSRADVVILPIPLNYPIIHAGEATRGYMNPAAEVNDPFPKVVFGKDGKPLRLAGIPTTYHGAHMWMRHSGDHFGGRLGVDEWTAVAVHEFGHVLGLGHETRGCSVMNPGGLRSPACGRLQEWQHFCGSFLAPDDVAGAVKLYGGHVRKRPIQVCDDTSAPMPPTALTADMSHGWPLLRWTLAEPQAKLLGVIIKRGENTCPSEVGSTKSLTAKPQGPWSDDVLPAGSWCYSVWVVRSNGQPSARPATVTVTVT
ncbi:MAG: M10 family metallopeptidase domain-containing protein [Actinomycetota bacterium]|nr:M10 family metallopeptidase domain-containing protein [Actinomycetota bacterium]